MNNSLEAIYITDLSRCQPKTALSDRDRRDYWRKVPYEAEGFSGTMLLAGIDGSAPTLSLPLGVHGWHAIHLGIWTPRTLSSIRVKLSSDSAFTVVTTPKGERWSSNWWTMINEAFWKFADLSDQDLLISQLSSMQRRGAAIAYVKLEPLSDNQVAAIDREQARTDTKRLIGHNDSYTFMMYHGTTTAEEIWQELEPFRGSDFGKILWDVGGGSTTFYRSKIGDSLEWEDDFDYWRLREGGGDLNVVESHRTLKEKGIDPLKTAIDYAHSIGLEILGSYRLAFWMFPPPEDNLGGFSGRFAQAHPEWQCVDWDGRPIARMSYAFPGVQQFVISLLREVVEMGADGVCLSFIRGVPCVLYEQPLVDGFKEKYGQDPRELPQDDPRWLAYKAAWITEFIRAVRREMNELGEQLGRRVQVGAYVLDNVPYCMSYGLDIGAWAREGLVDFVIPSSTRNKLREAIIGARFVKDTLSGTTLGQMGGEGVHVDVAGFAELMRGTNCRLHADMLPRQMSPADFRQRALEYYEVGADGLAFWDISTASEHRLCYLDQWSMVRRLGHKEELADWAPDEWPSYRYVQLRTLAGLTMDRHSPYWYG